MAFQQGYVVTEEEMVRATNRDSQPSIRRQTIINRLDVCFDLTSDRVGRITVVAQEEHEGLMEACLNDAAEWLTVHIDPCFAPGIVVAKLCGGPPPKGGATTSPCPLSWPSRILTR